MPINLVTSSAPCMSMRIPAHKKKQKEARKNKNKTLTRSKMGSQPILVPFLLENGKTVEKFEFFRYILTATVKNTQKKVPEILGRNFGNFSPVLSPMREVKKKYLIVTFTRIPNSLKN